MAVRTIWAIQSYMKYDSVQFVHGRFQCFCPYGTWLLQYVIPRVSLRLPWAWGYIGLSARPERTKALRALSFQRTAIICYTESYTESATCHHSLSALAFYWMVFIIKLKWRLFRPVLIVLPSYTARWQHCHRAMVMLPPSGGNAATGRCTMEWWACVNGRMLVCGRLKAYLWTAIRLCSDDVAIGWRSVISSPFIPQLFNLFPIRW